MKKTSFLSFNLPDKILGIEKSFLTLFVPPLVLLLLFLVILNSVLIPKINDIGVVNNKIKDVKASTDNIKEQNKYLKSIDQEQLKRNADYLDNAVLKDKKSYLLVEVIREVANKYNYQLDGFSLIPGELKDGGANESINVASSEETIAMPISLLMVGPKNRSLELILALERTLPILFINKFETKSVGDLSQLNLVISSYYIRDKANIETSSVTLSDLTLSEEESKLIERISSFTRIENVQAGVGSSTFQQYQRENPFSL